jgi:hypothetical protein
MASSGTYGRVWVGMMKQSTRRRKRRRVLMLMGGHEMKQQSFISAPFG